MERVAVGLKIVGAWSNSAGAGFLVSGYSSPCVDAPLPAGHGKLDQIGCLGLNFQNHDLFTNGYAGGTYSVSNFRLDYTNPPPFRITQTIYHPDSDTLTLT